MTPDRWQQAKGVFDQAIACPPEQREVLLRQSCGADEELYREVVSLLGSYATTDSFFEKPILAQGPAADPMIGRTFGVYQIVREIGRGGMGSVYLATRTDDQFRRRVALKAIKPELADDHALRRFQNERQTLAALDHPNIIKLLDGGQSEDGLPYLVMDYIEGQPIQEYCDSHKLTIPERLKLFRVVCAAVHYAHQNLVVHRDLKPANVLVTPDGVPKLLDFGIAKLLRPEFAAAVIGITRTRLQPMTPKYASPEQVTGQPITTSSDVYSLGVVLYELLTGRHPFEREARTELELERAIADLDPEKPSVAVTRGGETTEPVLARLREARGENLSRLLSGDLDAIVLMALRKEPQRRYPSADHLSEDLRRYLERLPVMARKGTVQYHLGKFVRRHKMGVAAALGIAVTLAASTFATYRAMQHTRSMFEDLRRFDNFVVKDLDLMLRRGGATPARQAVLAKALESLDRLAGEARGDPGLQTDVITAYIKMGDVQGNFFVPNLGEKNAAEESYRKALSVAETLWRARPADAAGKQQVADVYLKLGDVLANRREALDQYGKARDLYQSMAPDRAVQNAMMRAWDKTGATQGQLGDVDGALQSYRRALGLAQNLKRREAIEMLKERVAYFSALNGDAASSEEAVIAAIRSYRDGPAAENPRNEAAAYRVLAEVQKRAGKIEAALESVQKSLKITADLLAENPQDKLHQIDHEQGLVARIELLSATGRKRQEREETARALRLVKPWVEQPDVTDYQLQDYVRLLLSTPFPEFQDPAAALRYARILAGMTREADPKVLDLLARAYDRNDDQVHALETERKALALLPPVASGSRPSELRTTLETNLQAFQTRLSRKH